MKTRRFMLTAFASLFSLTMMAQGNEPAKQLKKDGPKDKQKKEMPTPQEVATKRTDKMNKDLALTAEQMQKVRDVNLKYAEKAEKAHLKARKEHDKKIAQHMKNEEQKDAKLKSILTKEQYDKMIQLREEKKAKKEKCNRKDDRMCKPGCNRPCGMPGENIKRPMPQPMDSAKADDMPEPPMMPED